MEYRYAALLVVAAVIAYGLRLYHKRRGTELEQRHAKHHGWETRAISVRHEMWICPDCRTPLLSWQDVLGHQSVRSACIAHVDRLTAADALEQAGQTAAAAGDAGRWNVSATVGGEVHSGAVDSFTPPALEGGQDDD